MDIDRIKGNKGKDTKGKGDKGKKGKGKDGKHDSGKGKWSSLPTRAPPPRAQVQSGPPRL